METRDLRNRISCRECGHVNAPVAHFCGRCGEPLDASSPTVGRARHPSPCAIPAGFERVQRATDLYYRLNSAWGGPPLIGTETLCVNVFNAGYALKNAVLRLEGLDASSRRVFEVTQLAPQLPRGEIAKIEIPSYEIPEPASEIIVALASAEYA